MTAHARCKMQMGLFVLNPYIAPHNACLNYPVHDEGCRKFPKQKNQTFKITLQAVISTLSLNFVVHTLYKYRSAVTYSVRRGSGSRITHCNFSSKPILSLTCYPIFVFFVIYLNSVKRQRLFFVKVFSLSCVKKSTKLDFVHLRMIGPSTTQRLFFNTYFLRLLAIFHSYRPHGSFSNADTK